MLQPASLFTRIAIGKGIGLIVGLICMASLPLFLADIDTLFRWGVLFWYTTMGAFIGVFGVFTWHPVLKLPMPWWFRSTLIGAWMNFVLVLLTHTQLDAMLQAPFVQGSILASPWWLVPEGGVVGLMIGFFATLAGGEGKAIVDERPPVEEPSARFSNKL
ncbi:MAG: hypothetical protein HKN56_04615 [Gammaproteobacteria bacterium]|nr:hypothetical protein [Gammaproteobacteria bacterium]NND54238.1 hypothetical protein [Gammaproteobacteria bacterium]